MRENEEETPLQSFPGTSASDMRCFKHKPGITTSFMEKYVQLAVQKYG